VNGSWNEPGPLGSRFGAFGGLVKRVVARLIRFYTFRQDAVNSDIEARLQLLEGVPEAGNDGQIQVRAAHAALAARVTHLQREIAQLRERLEQIENAAE
jgi:hypothetical protein